MKGSRRNRTNKAVADKNGGEAATALPKPEATTEGASAASGGGGEGRGTPSRPRAEGRGTPGERPGAFSGGHAPSGRDKGAQKLTKSKHKN